MKQLHRLTGFIHELTMSLIFFCGRSDWSNIRYTDNARRQTVRACESMQ